MECRPLPCVARPSLKNFDANRWVPPRDFHPPHSVIDKKTSTGILGSLALPVAAAAALCPSQGAGALGSLASAAAAVSSAAPPPLDPAVRTWPASPPFPTLILTGAAIVEPAFVVVAVREVAPCLAAVFTPFVVHQLRLAVLLQKRGWPPRPQEEDHAGGDFEDEAQGLAQPQSMRKRVASQLLRWPR
ncbi:hypothetical protein EJB05_40597, partial [Eragrostis curvula]